MAPRTFSLEYCTISMGTLLPASGFASGDAFTASFPENDFERHQSTHGDVIWIQKPNKVMECMLRLGQGNSQIDLIRQLHSNSVALGGIFYPFSATNLKAVIENVAGMMIFTQHVPIKWADSEQPYEVKFDLYTTTLTGGAQLPGPFA